MVFSKASIDHVASISCAISPPAYALYDTLVHQLADFLRGAFLLVRPV